MVIFASEGLRVVGKRRLFGKGVAQLSMRGPELSFCTYHVLHLCRVYRAGPAAVLREWTF